MRTRSWVAILHSDVAERVMRGGCRRLPLNQALAPRVVIGDHVALLAARGPLFVEDSRFVALAETCRVDEAGIALRKIVAAPPGHEVALAALASLRVSAGWTHGSLGGLVGTVVPCNARDMARIASALLAQARAYGPTAKRPAHSRPRTPGRRHLLAGRIAARGRS